MPNYKLLFLILLNTPFKRTEAGKIRLTHNFQSPHSLKNEETRLKKEIEHSLAADVLLRDKVSELAKASGDSYLSVAMEHMDAPSLLKLLDKLKEEYAAKAKKGDAEEVRSSFDKLTATLVKLSKARRPNSEPEEILSQLSEEMLDDEAGAYSEEIYSEGEYSKEEESSNPSLLPLQSKNKKISAPSTWDW